MKVSEPTGVRLADAAETPSDQALGAGSTVGWFDEHRWEVFMARQTWVAGILALVAPAWGWANDFTPPTRIEVDGKPINVQVGHAAPFRHDLDGDGAFDLLVGQFGQGKLLWFRNTGSNAEPRFAAGVFVKAGNGDAMIPAG